LGIFHTQQLASKIGLRCRNEGLRTMMGLMDCPRKDYWVKLFQD